MHMPSSSAGRRNTQDEFGAAVDFKFMKKARERADRDKVVQAKNQAQHDVFYFTEFLERERVRARAIVMYAGASEAEAAAIVADAQAKLDAAQERLKASG